MNIYLMIMLILNSWIRSLDDSTLVFRKIIDESLYSFSRSWFKGRIKRKLKDTGTIVANKRKKKETKFFFLSHVYTYIYRNLYRCLEFISLEIFDILSRYNALEFSILNTEELPRCYRIYFSFGMKNFDFRYFKI